MSDPTATPHHPHRGDHVAIWIKYHRDQHDTGSPEWDALDGLLENYRERADTGTPLHRIPQGPHPEASLTPDAIEHLFRPNTGNRPHPVEPDESSDRTCWYVIRVNSTTWEQNIIGRHQHRGVADLHAIIESLPERITWALTLGTQHGGYSHHVWASQLHAARPEPAPTHPRWASR